jgi:hypothetical protein
MPLLIGQPHPPAHGVSLSASSLVRTFSNSVCGLIYPRVSLFTINPMIYPRMDIAIEIGLRLAKDNHGVVV